MIPGAKGHVFRACTKKHDFGTRKTRISSHFSTKNERIMSVLSLQSALHEASGIKVGGKIPFDPNIIL